MRNGLSMNDAVIVSEWNSDRFHRLVLEMENKGYVCRQETYRITPEVNPVTGEIIHLHSVELYRPDPEDE